MEDEENENQLKNFDVCDQNSYSLKNNTTCFLCSKYNQLVVNPSHQGINSRESHVPIKLENDLHSSEKFSLRSIIRYLNINLKEIFASGLNTDYHQYNWEDLHKFLKDSILNFLVTLCNKCSKVVVNLSQLCMELELLQMKLKHCLKSFTDLMDESADEDHTFQFQNNMLSSEPPEEINRRADEILKKEIKRKCEIKLGHITPKVMVTNHKIRDEILNGNREIKIVKTSTPPQLLVKLEHDSISPCTSEDEYSPSSSSANSDEEPFTPKEKFKTMNKNRQETCSRKQTSSSAKTIRNTCYKCSPPRQVKSANKKRHQITYHLETLLITFKQDSLSMTEFKEYCQHVLQVELLSGVVKYDAGGNPALGCPNCLKVYHNRDTLRFHVYSAHEEILARKLVELQQSTSFDELKSIQLPTSFLSKNDVWKCDNCGGTFTHHSSLLKHKKNRCVFATGRKQPIKKFKCDFCNRYFTHRFTLDRHRQQIHGQPPEKKRKSDKKDYSQTKVGLLSAMSKGIDDGTLEQSVVVVSKVEVFGDQSDGDGIASIQKYLCDRHEYEGSSSYAINNEMDTIIVPDVITTSDLVVKIEEN